MVIWTLHLPALFSVTIVILLAWPATGLWRAWRTWSGHQRKKSQAYKDFRIIQAYPLKFRKQLFLKLAISCFSYLHVCIPSVEDFFAYWEKSTHLLKPSVGSYRNPQVSQAGDTVAVLITKSEMRRAQQSLLCLNKMEPWGFGRIFKSCKDYSVLCDSPGKCIPCKRI